MAKSCGFSRLLKDGGGPGVGPLAPIDPWVGEDVHVDIPGGDRRNRRRQGIAAAPSVHKALDCPDGEHMHDRFDYCHPEQRKHRKPGGAKQTQEEKPDFVVKYNTALKKKRELHKDYADAWKVVYDSEKSGGNVDEARQVIKMVRDELYDTNSIIFELKRMVMQWRKTQRPDAGLREKYTEVRAAWAIEKDSEKTQELYVEMKRLEDEIRGMAIEAGEKRLSREVKDMMQAAQDTLKWPMNVEHVIMAGRSFASYTDKDKTIRLSPRSIKMIRKFQKESAEGEMSQEQLERASEFTSVLLHELSHSINPIKIGDYYGQAKLLEEGLTEWVARYMGKSFASKILGREFDWDKATKGQPPEQQRGGDAYGRMMMKVADYARTAANGFDAGTPYYITKWKFNTPPSERTAVISEDLVRAMVLAKTGIKATPEQMDDLLESTMEEMHAVVSSGYGSMAKVRDAFGLEKAWFISNATPPEQTEDNELLPWQKRIRIEAWKRGQWSPAWGEKPEQEPFSRMVRKLMERLWGVPDFVFKVAGGAGSYEPYPPSTPAPTGGGGSGPGSASSALVPSNMDIRYTGSPPKGVRWQKFPRQGGEAVGGAGAGAVEAALDEPCEKC